MLHKKKFYIFVICLFFILSFYIFRIIQSEYNYTINSFSITDSVVFTDKEVITQDKHQNTYYLTVSYNMYGDKENILTFSGDDHDRKSILYDSIFTNKQYMSINCEIRMPINEAKNNNVLIGDTTLDLNLFFDKDTDFINKWLKIVSVQAE